MSMRAPPTLKSFTETVMYKGAALNSGGASSDSAKEMIVVPKAADAIYPRDSGGMSFWTQAFFNTSRRACQ